MIDWITMRAYLPHRQQITGGLVLCCDAGGVEEWHTVRRAAVRGSWEAGLQVRSTGFKNGVWLELEVSGNPVKFFQGHNLWGTDDLPGLVLATLDSVASLLRLKVPPVARLSWQRGEVTLTRVDCTESYHLANRGEVLSWLRAAEQTAHLTHRGRGQLVKGTTLYFGKHSRRWSLKFYSKGQEIEAKGHGQDAILDLPAARAWADRTLRGEVTLRSMELKRLGLATASAWANEDIINLGKPGEIVRDRVSEMSITTVRRLESAVLENLTPAARTAVIAWEAGADLPGLLPRSTFYRYRRQLLGHGIDLATRLPKDCGRIIPLHRVLEARPVGVPDWAEGTPLYFEPRRAA